MIGGTLRTFKNAREYRLAVQGFEADGLKRIPMGANFLDMGHELALCERGYVDMTSCLAWLESNNASLLAIERMLEAANDNVVFIAKEDKACFALDKLPLYFESSERLHFGDGERCLKRVMTRKPLLVYKRRAAYDALVKRSQENVEFRFETFLWLRDNAQVVASELVNGEREILVDLTSFVAMNISSLMLAFESVDAMMPGSLNYIVSERGSNEIYESFPSIFGSIKDVEEVYPDLVLEEEREVSGSRSYCDLSPKERATLNELFKIRLTGHSRFKEEFEKALEAFVVSNTLRDKRILSVFLFGESGVGKTETARLLNELLAPGSRLAKINFESYSSKDSLNSLIGSPAGYIGCEGGELNDKTSKSRSKVLLCDEFDKTGRDVQNFFLELLEDGFYTDRMGVEHDLDGYIIVFTSNLRSEKEFDEGLPRELRTRFDVICEFVEPTTSEKASHAVRFAEEKARSYEHRLGLASGSIDSSAVLSGLSSVAGYSLREIDKAICSRVAEIAASLNDA